MKYSQDVLGGELELDLGDSDDAWLYNTTVQDDGQSLFYLAVGVAVLALAVAIVSIRKVVGR